MSVSRVPSPSGASSSRSRSLPHRKAKTFGGSSSTTRPSIGSARCGSNVKRIAPPSRRSTSTVLGNHEAISSGTVIERQTRSTGWG